jgi:hypothetical protein
MYKISQRRVQQLRKEYKDTGEIPRLISTRRPKTELSEKDKEIIRKAWNEERVGARLLYYDLGSLQDFLKCTMAGYMAHWIT